MGSRSEEKVALRSRARELRGALGGAYRREATESLILRVAKQLRDHEELIGLFAGIHGEPELFQHWPFPFPVALPRVEGNHLTLWKIESRDQVVTGYRGILEPDVDHCTRVSLCELKWLLVPGLAFSCETGARLGQGGGFYDRLLAGRLRGEMPRIVGVCFEAQLVRSIPMEEFDQTVDCVCTERRWLEVEVWED
ncbi:MAG: 5-formyltetrahydrofolate cyclo-ligase [Verrucomicrobiota bacterium]